MWRIINDRPAASNDRSKSVQAHMSGTPKVIQDGDPTDAG